MKRASDPAAVASITSSPLHIECEQNVHSCCDICGACAMRHLHILYILYPVVKTDKAKSNFPPTRTAHRSSMM